MAAKSDWHWFLGDERELVHPMAGSLSCSFVHEFSRTVSSECLFSRVVEFASLVLQDDIPVPLCPATTEELLLFSV